MHAWLCTNPTGVEALAWTELPTPTPQPETPAEAQLAGSDLGDQPADAARGQLPPTQGLTPEQAARLLAATAKDTQTLQEHLQQLYVVPPGAVGKDW